MFGQLHARLNNLDNLLYEYAVEANERFGRLEERIAIINEKVRAITTTRYLVVISLQAHNMTAADGLAIPFHDVRFPNGDLHSEYGVCSSPS